MAAGEAEEATEEAATADNPCGIRQMLLQTRRLAKLSTAIKNNPHDGMGCFLYWNVYILQSIVMKTALKPSY